MADEWYYRVDGREQGPVLFENITDLAQSGTIGHSDEIRNGETSAWMVADSVVGLFPEPQVLSDLGDLPFTFEESPRDGLVDSTQQQTVNSPAEIGDLSELDIELVSSDPITASEETVRQPTEPFPPTSSTGGAIPDDGEEGWYYQSLGQELGPMPFEEMCRLAEGGVISLDDLIRKGTLSEWSQASAHSTMSMLLRSAAMTEAKTSSPSAAKPAEPPKTPKRRNATKKTKVKTKTAPAEQKDEPTEQALAEKIQAKQTLAEQTIAEQALASDIVDDDEPLDNEPSEPLDNGPSDLVDEETDSAPPQTAEATRWFCLIDEIEHGPLEFSNLKSMAEHKRLRPQDQVRSGDTGAWKAAVSVAGLFASGGPNPAVAGSSSAAVPGSWKVSATAGPSSPTAPPKPMKPAKRPKRKRIKNPGESLFSKLGEHKPVLFGLLGIVAVLGIVGLLSLLDLGGSGESDYLALQEIWKEHKALQNRKADKNDWKPLIAKAEELNASLVPRLDKIGNPRDHRFEQELLYAARDHLIPMLKNSRGKPTKDQRSFEAHMKLAKKMLDNPGDLDIQSESAELD